MGPLAFAQLICMQHDNNIESLWLAAYKLCSLLALSQPFCHWHSLHCWPSQWGFRIKSNTMDPPKKICICRWSYIFFSPTNFRLFYFFWLLCDFDSGQRNCLLIRQLSTVFRAFSSGTSGLSNFYQNLISTTRGTNHKMASVSFRPVCVCVWICVCMRSGFSVLHTRYSVFCGIGFAVCIYLAENCRSIKTGQPVESWRAKKLFLISLPAILLFNLSSFLFPFLAHTHTYTFSCL